MPKRVRMLPNSCTVAPNTLREATMWSPLFSSAMTRGQDRRHAGGGGDAALGALERGEALLRTWSPSDW